MNRIFYAICLCQWISIRTSAYEIDRQESNGFLQRKLSSRKQYEFSRETVETTRESCLNEYQQQLRSAPRRQSLSPFCQQYCAETNDCQQESEPSACLDASWPSRTLKYSLKFQRVCYVRITEVLQYRQAEDLCHKHGLQLAVIDNLALLKQLKESQMFNSTCKGQCPEARGYYIGLRRMLDDPNSRESKWIWSNDVTWTENQTQCDESLTNRSLSWLQNASLLCYNGSDGEQKVTVWNEGEPNNHRYSQFQPGEHCVEIIGRTDRHGGRWDQVGKLNDIPCNKPTLGVICQKEDTKPVNNTRFDYFATLIGYNESEPAETDGNDLLGNLLANFDGTISPSLDAVAAMAAALEGLLVLPSFTTEQAGNVLNVVDQLVNVTGQVEVEDDSLKVVTNKLLNFLDVFSGKIEIDEDTSTSFIYDNMNTSLVDLTVDHWDDFQDHQWFTINGTDENPNSIIELNLPALRRHLTNTDHYRLIETMFLNFNLFPQANGSNTTSTQQLLAMPISYQIANWTHIQTTEDLVRFQIRVPDPIQSFNLSCAYWSFEKNNGSWISDHGCRFVGYRNGYAECYCNHLTHFALLMLPESEKIIQSLSSVEEFILTFVTYIGIALSIFGLIITLITYTLFRCSQRNRIHASLFMLCVSILCVNCLYIPFSLTKPTFSSGHRNPFCNVMGFFFHYFLITSFFWMFIMAIIQYMQFVRIFNSHISHFFVKASCIGWLFPLAFPFSVILLGANGGYIGEHRCWINNRLLLYLTLVVPIAIIILLNSVLFIFTIKSIFHHDPSISSHHNSRSKLQIGASMCCFASIGCTWIFGILVLLRPSFLHQLIFCICNSLQGFLIFLFHVYLSKPKRELWQTFFIQHGLHQRPHSSSTSGQTQLIAKSHSSTANLSSLTRPVKFRFTSSLSNHLDPLGATASLNRSFTDQSLNSSTAAPTKSISHSGIASQADFFRERFQQKNRLPMSQLYA